MELAMMEDGPRCDGVSITRGVGGDELEVLDVCFPLTVTSAGIDIVIHWRDRVFCPVVSAISSEESIERLTLNKPDPNVRETEFRGKVREQHTGSRTRQGWRTVNSSYLSSVPLLVPSLW